VDHLLAAEAASLAELQSQTGWTIRLQVEVLYGVDQYDLVMV
jgi:hypothetical protein